MSAGSAKVEVIALLLGVCLLIGVLWSLFWASTTYLKLRGWPQEPLTTVLGITEGQIRR